MKKRLNIKLDKKYVKICSYASITVIITVVLLILLYLSGGVWATIWELFTAVLRPVVIGGILWYLLTPLATKCEQGLKARGFDKYARTGGVFLTVVLALIVILGLFSILIFTLLQTVNSLGSGGIEGLVNYVQHDFSAFSAKIQKYLEMLGLSVATVSNVFNAVLNSISRIATSLLFGAIFAVYFLLDSNSISTYWLRAAKVISGKKSAEPLQRFLDDADRVFSGYIRGQFIDAMIIGIMTTLAMLIIKVPNAITVGVLTGCGNLIPYVGPVVGYLTLALVCIPTGAWSKLILGAVILAVLLFVDGNIINPKLLSSNVMIHPLLVIAALIGGGAVGGIVGMIVAVPTAALLKVQLDRYLDKREMAEMIAEREPLNVDDIPE